MQARVFARKSERVLRNIGAEHRDFFIFRSLARDGDGDRPAARAEIEHAVAVFQRRDRLTDEKFGFGTGNEHPFVHLDGVSVKIGVSVDVPERSAREAFFVNLQNARALLARDDALLGEPVARDIQVQTDDPLRVRRVDVLLGKPLLHHGEQTGKFGLGGERLFGGIRVVVHLFRLPEGENGALDLFFVRFARGEHLQQIPGRFEGQHEHGIGEREEF